MIQKILFFFFIIVIAFLPGGIFISVFLLALYYLAPSLASNNFHSKEKTDVFESKFPLGFSNLIEPDQSQSQDMQSYSKDTLEEWR